MGSSVIRASGRGTVIIMIFSALPALLGGMAVAGSTWGLSDASVPRISAVSDLEHDPSSIRPETRPAREVFADVWARPLFSPARRPRNADSGSAGLESSRIQLVAVVEFQGRREACLKILGEGEVRWLREGDELEQWRLAVIGTDEVYLRKGRDVVKLIFG